MERKGRERIVRVGTIIQDVTDNKFLVVHQIESEYWGFPKGSLKPPETISQGALRELYEETSIEGKMLPQISHDVIFRQNHYLLFQTSRKPETKILDHKEIDQIRWISLEELNTLNISNTTKYILGILYECLQEITLSEIDTSKEIEKLGEEGRAGEGRAVEVIKAAKLRGGFYSKFISPIEVIK